jgi:Interferon-induced transmembrane protein/TIR domain
MARTIFISYARRDEQQVAQLASDVARSGHVVFYDQELTGGTPWWDRLLEKIEQCDLFMPVVSEQYARSDPCAREATYAAAYGKPFLPVAIGSPNKALFARHIAEMQWVIYNPADRDALLDLSRALNLAEPCPAPPAERPARPDVPISYMDEWVRKIEDPTEMSRADQMLLLSELRARTDPPDREAVDSLLRSFRSRPDIFLGVATEIDAVLATNATGPAPIGAPVASAPPGPPAAPPPSVTPTAPPPGPAPAPSAAPGPGLAPATAPQPMAAARPENYLVWSILVTLFCCLPLGAVAIYYSTQVNKHYDAGDMAKALQASKTTRTWIIVCAVTGLAVFAIYVIAAAASTSSSTTLGPLG